MAVVENAQYLQWWMKQLLIYFHKSINIFYTIYYLRSVEPLTIKLLNERVVSMQK